MAYGSIHYESNDSVLVADKFEKSDLFMVVVGKEYSRATQLFQSPQQAIDICMKIVEKAKESLRTTDEQINPMRRHNDAH